MSKEKSDIEKAINFIKMIEPLKDTTRTAWTQNGRRESVAEHSWRLSMLALVLEDYFEEIDFNKVIKLCLVHDIGEVYDGDISAITKVDEGKKLRDETKAIKFISSYLGEKSKTKFVDLWQEYTNGSTIEAIIAKALDKIETIIQHNQGDNPEDFNYKFNLEYGKEYSLCHEIVTKIREIVDNDTLKNINYL
ncbi:MAG: HD domain-containing protein [Clostridiales bacterium]